jgi:hypothetical protein
LPYRLSGHNLLFRRLMLALIQSDPKYTGNDLVSTSHGLGMACKPVSVDDRRPSGICATVP